APYMPQLIANAREQITRVLKAELCKKDQIKTALIAQYIYHGQVSKGKEEDINEHIDKSILEIDEKIDSFMKSGSGWNLVRIETLTIEAYTLRRAVGGSYISTLKKLANTKCTINPDNSKIIDPVTGIPSDNCLQGALACYFANKDGHTEHLERIFTKKDYRQYLNIVNLEMPTLICSCIFNKIEEMNPDISINV
ncbi:5053_t:CDS:2, partial [Ambispora leptoticha]